MNAFKKKIPLSRVSVLCWEETITRGLVRSRGISFKHDVIVLNPPWERFYVWLEVTMACFLETITEF